MSKQGVLVLLGAAIFCALPGVSSAQGPSGFYSPYYYLRHGSYYEPNYYGSARPTNDSSPPTTNFGPEYSPYDYLRHGTYSQPSYIGRTTSSYYSRPSYYYTPSSSYYTPSPVVNENAKSATVEVRVPANAELWIDGSPTQQRGENRKFETPAFSSGNSYRYDLRARWTDSGGKVVEQTRQVTLQAGQQVKVDFTTPEGDKKPK